MRNVDEMIDEALDSEQRDLLARIGDEPGFFGMVLGLFSGRLGWVNVLLMVVQTALFVASVYAGWRFFGATDTVAQLRWGLPAATMLILSLMLKLAVWPEVHANRMIRELRRLELALVRSRGSGE